MNNDLFDDVRDHAFWGTILLLFGIILGSVGCAGSYTYREPDREVEAPVGAEEAIYAIENYLAMPTSTIVYWYGKNMDCHDGVGWIHEGQCIDGVYYDWSGEAAVSIMKGAPIHETPLAHEMCHAWSLYKTGNSDGNHEGDCFVNKMEGITQMLIDGGF